MTENNECEGCPPYEDGIKSEEMCWFCDYWEEENNA